MNSIKKQRYSTLAIPHETRLRVKLLAAQKGVDVVTLVTGIIERDLQKNKVPFVGEL